MSKSSSSGGDKGGGVYLSQQGQKPKNIFEALNELEFFAASESEGEPIPEKFFTIKQRLDFMEVGFKSAFLSGMITALLSPFMIGVFEKIIPVFGTYNSSILDQIYVFLLTVGFAIGYGIFISRMAKCYKYGVSKEMAKNIMIGLWTGGLLKMFFVFLLFHFIYFQVLSPEWCKKAFVYLYEKKWVSDSLVIDAYKFILEFRKVFLTAAWFVVGTTLAFLLIPTLRILKVKWEVRKERQAQTLE